MQNVATSIFYARLFAGIYDALPAAFFSYLPIHLLRCFFLSRHHTRLIPFETLSARSVTLLSPALRAQKPSADLLAFSLFLRPRFCFFLRCLVYLVRRHSMLLPFLSLARQIWTCCFLLDVFFAVRRFLPSFRSPLRSSSLQLRLVSVASSSGKCVTKDNLVGTLFFFKGFLLELWTVLVRSLLS